MDESSKNESRSEVTWLLFCLTRACLACISLRLESLAADSLDDALDLAESLRESDFLSVRYVCSRSMVCTTIDFRFPIGAAMPSASSYACYVKKVMSGFSG